MKRLALVLLAVLPALAAQAEKRFPKPEFASGYRPPATQYPMPDAWPGWVWCLLLLAFLVLGGLALYRWRSRRIQVCLMAAAVLLFGFERHGCICAVGSLQNVAAAAADPGFPLSWTVIAFFALPLLTALFFGRIFCGSACPLGALQELLHWKTLHVPRLPDRLLRLVPLFYLAFAVLLAAAGARFIVCEDDPYVALFRLDGPRHMLAFGAGMLLLGLFVSRPYCRYCCPYGVLLRWAAMLSPFKVSVTPDKCINCRLCEKACPNEAILPPAPSRQEPRRRAIQGMTLLLGLTPAIMALGAVAGTLLGPWLASLHPDTQLLLALQAPEKNEAAVAFLSTGVPVETLAQRVREIEHFLTVGGGIAGALLGLAVVFELVLLARCHEAREYSVSGPDCYACSRCYSSCPVPPPKPGK